LYICRYSNENRELPGKSETAVIFLFRNPKLNALLKRFCEDQNINECVSFQKALQDATRTDETKGRHIIDILLRCFSIKGLVLILELAIFNGKTIS
jgi:hypothetical protein